MLRGGTYHLQRNLYMPLVLESLFHDLSRLIRPKILEMNGEAPIEATLVELAARITAPPQGRPAGLEDKAWRPSWRTVPGLQIPWVESGSSRPNEQSRMRGVRMHLLFAYGTLAPETRKLRTGRLGGRRRPGAAL